MSIHACRTIASYFLPDWLVRFHARFPGIELSVAVGNTAQVARAVAQGDAALGFVEGPVSHPQLAAELVGTDQMIVVVAKGHPWAGKAALSPAALAEASWVLREDGSGTCGVHRDVARPRSGARGFAHRHCLALERSRARGGS